MTLVEEIDYSSEKEESRRQYCVFLSLLNEIKTSG